jgi:hypothetical protein
MNLNGRITGAPLRCRKRQLAMDVIAVMGIADLNGVNSSDFGFIFIETNACPRQKHSRFWDE